MKHQADEFIGKRGQLFCYRCTCGLPIQTPTPLSEDGTGIEVNADDGKGVCPTCFPERVAASLDGVPLHPDLGALEVEDDVIAEEDPEAPLEEEVEEA